MSLLLVDVSPRDGLQNESRTLATSDKILLIDGLAKAGVRRIEATSFVNPKIIPQLADADAVMAGINRVEGTKYGALVPNMAGLERAVAAGVDFVNAVVLSTETFNQRNVRRSVSDTISEIRAMARHAENRAIPISVILGASFVCPFEGPVEAAHALGVIEMLVDAGIEEITLADTTGQADPRRVGGVLGKARDRWKRVSFGLHLHDTRGVGLANAFAGLEAGVERFEASLGGIGGCPFTPSSGGNVCLEDLGLMLESMGIPTRLDFAALQRLGMKMANILGHALPSKMLARCNLQGREDADTLGDDHHV